MEGSRSQTQRAAMQIALARHDALLRQVIERHHGHVVKSISDGACAVFASATDALEAAIAAQQALGDKPRPEPVRIRARMALHSGPRNSATAITSVPRSIARRTDPILPTR
jgi:class 3 adenylate cyclase